MVTRNVSNGKHETSFRGLGNKPLSSFGRINCIIRFKNLCFQHELIILPNEEINIPLILGRDFLNKCNIALCLKNNKDVFKSNDTDESELINKNSYFCIAERDKISSAILSCSNNIMNIDDRVVSSGQMSGLFDSVQFCDKILYDSMYESVSPDVCTIQLREQDEIDMHLDINKSLTDNSIQMIKHTICEEYLCPVDLEVKPHSSEMHIRLTNNTPFHTMPRRLSYFEKVEVQKILDDLSKQKVIRPSQSPYASAIVLVKKKSGDIRLCVYFRNLNKITARDNYPLPLIEDCLGYLGAKKVFLHP